MSSLQWPTIPVQIECCNFGKVLLGIALVLIEKCDKRYSLVIGGMCQDVQSHTFLNMAFLQDYSALLAMTNHFSAGWNLCCILCIQIYNVSNIQGTDAQEAKEAGADIVGGKELIPQVSVCFCNISLPLLFRFYCRYMALLFLLWL